MGIMRDLGDGTFVSYDESRHPPVAVQRGATMTFTLDELCDIRDALTRQYNRGDLPLRSDVMGVVGMIDFKIRQAER